MAKSGEMVWHPQSYITDIPENYKYVQVLKDHWWALDENNNVAFYEDRSPQCNPNEKLMRNHVERGVAPGAVTIEKIPVAFVPISISDYC